MEPKSPPSSFESDPRVLLAAERTLLAWVRTGVAMMGFGFVVARFGLFLRELAAAGGRPMTHASGLSPFLGTGLIVLGALVTALATVEHVAFLRRYDRGETLRPRYVSLSTVLAGVLVVAGVALAVYLLRV
jgi:putative membrane protein